MATNSKFPIWVPGWAGVFGIMMGWCTHVRAESPPPSVPLTEAERSAVFRAAGAVQRKGMWLICAEEPNPSGAVIESVRDLNGDGLPEALVTEGGTYCYGHAETGYQLLSRQADGRWRVVSGGSGMPEFLKTRGKGGWPDISIGGPGFCFPVERWDGKEYKLNRFEYEGKRCKPPR